MSTSRVKRLVCAAFFLAAIFVSTTQVEGADDSRWVSISEAEEGAPPEIMVIESTAERTVIEIDLPGFWARDREIDGTLYQELEIPGQTTMWEVGKPALPVIRFLVGVPDDADVCASATREGDLSLEGYRVFPFQEPETDAAVGPFPWRIDKRTYESAAAFPETIAGAGEPSLWRYLRVVLVEVTPVSFLSRQGELIVRPRMTVTLDYTPGSTVNVLEGPLGTVSPQWESLYREHVVNYEWLDRERGGGQDTPGPVYLIITHPNFEASIQPLAEWHHREGLETEVVSISTTSAQAIKNEIIARWNEGSLDYVLLVGDVSYIPVYYWSGFLSDYWYACLTGGPDVYADIAVGRLSVTTTAQATAQVSKILAYEKNPPLDEWLTDIILVAHREDAPGKYVACKEYIRDNIIPQPPFDVDTIYGHLSNGTNSHVSTDINAGCNIVNYRGHGSSVSWPEWDYDYASWLSSHIGSLTNGDKTPIVFNIACDCHMIQGTCLGETWLNKDPGGAVASLGASDPSYTDANHDYDKELFRQFNEYGQYRIGYMSNAAATYIIDHHGSYGQDNAKMYLWLGDPATEVWTGIPDSLLAAHPAEILTESQEILVTITYDGAPIEGASVCLYKQDEVYEVATTGADGVASLTVEPLTGGTLLVTVSAHDLLPYEGGITVIEYTPEVTLTLTADADSFPRGGELGYTVGATNDGPAPLTVDYWAEVYLPGGSPYAGNPVFGPVTVTIPSGASPSVHLTHHIPPGAPLWTYTYRACAGVYGGEVWSEDSFPFTVTEP
jgi:hypothetical protein